MKAKNENQRQEERQEKFTVKFVPCALHRDCQAVKFMKIKFNCVKVFADYKEVLWDEDATNSLSLFKLHIEFFSLLFI